MSSQSPLPIHLCFFLTILFMFVSFSWYSSYESMFEGLFDNLKMVFILSPVLLLVVLQLMSTFDTSGRYPMYVGDYDPSSSATPWGVGLVLVLLFFLLSYQSDLREKWGAAPTPDQCGAISSHLPVARTTPLPLGYSNKSNRNKPATLAFMYAFQEELDPSEFSS
ncbi:hypothetical protein Tco_1555578 [Tanacetum coccineum]